MDTRPWGANVVAFPSTYIAEALHQWPKAFPKWNDAPDIAKLRTEWNLIKVCFRVRFRAEDHKRPPVPEDAAGTTMMDAPSPGFSLSPFADHAERFVKLGYSPIARFRSTNGGGDSYPRAWSDYCAAVAPEELRRQWGASSNAMVAVACGFKGLVPLDVDVDDKPILDAVLKTLPQCRIARREARASRF